MSLLLTWEHFTRFYSVSIAHFEQVNVSWAKNCFRLIFETIVRTQPSYRNQQIDLLCDAIHWFLLDGSVDCESVKSSR